MRKKVQHIIKSLVICASLLVMSDSATAYYQQDPCCDYPCQNRRFAVEGEFIYFKPQFDDPFYATTSSSGTLTLGDRHANDFSFEPGFRIGAYYSLCDCAGDLGIRWTRLHTSTSDSASGIVLIKGFNDDFLGTASANFELDYDAIDFFYRRAIYFECPFDLVYGAGLHVDFFKFDNTVSTTGQAVISDAGKIKTWGIGPEVFFQGQYRFTNCFSLVMNAKTALLAQHYDVKRVEVLSGTTIIDLQDDKIWRLVPFFDIRFGINSQFCVCRFPISVEVGYEFLDYVKALYFIDSNGRFPTSPIYRDISFQGPYVNLNISF